MKYKHTFKSLTVSQKFAKRSFDLFFSVLGLLMTWWLILVGWFLAKKDTGESGFFLQERVGFNGQLFKIIKLRTMKSSKHIKTSITTSNDLRITKIGAFLRKTKIDELPQLINVLKGEMSFVGPRPDVLGYADKLKGDDKIILSVRPGITGPATLYFKDEEKLLSRQSNPIEYNDNVIYPKKTKFNKKYIYNYSFITDIKYIIKTIFG